MTLDHGDRQVTYSQFVGSDSKSGIRFALNNDPEAQNSCNFRIIAAEMSHVNDP